MLRSLNPCPPRRTAPWAKRSAKGIGPVTLDSTVGSQGLTALCLAVSIASFALADGLVAPPPGLSVQKNAPDQIVLYYAAPDFIIRSVAVGVTKYARIELPGEPQTQAPGAPAVPFLARSIVVPADAEMTLNVLDGQYVDYPDLDVAPARRTILRNENPDEVPYEFGPEYELNAFFPGELATLEPPYILRSVRGAVVRLHPFRYNPATRTLRVYTWLKVEIVHAGPGRENVLRRDRDRGRSRAFDVLYQRHFINYEPDTRYAPLDETGDLLIIAHNAWIPNVEPLAAHKNSIGVNTTVVGVSAIGVSATAIKNYIQSVYDSSDLAFVLLVGDAEQIPPPYASGGAADPSYAKLAGSDDYPDVMVGRFSAESAADVDTQVARTIAYESMPATAMEWFWKGAGIASDQGPGDDGEYDHEHIDNIRDDLLASGYSQVDQIYDPSASASQVTSALEAGRGVVTYCGHGSTTAWGSSGFSNTHVNSLVNDGMLPFIFSVACVNGAFDGPTCFGEAWLRATHDGEPTGAIGAYMSSINQLWNPPMAAQDEFIDLLVAEAYVGLGSLCYAGSCAMMDEYGAAGVEMFDTWILFGDPSLRVGGVAAPPDGLGVAPAGGLIAGGPQGGPFTPDSRVYVLENYSGTPLTYEVDSTAAWVSITNGTGTIPAQDSVDVTIALNSAAAALGHGTYEDTVAFTNLTNGVGDTTRTVTLTVGVPSVQYEWTMDADPGWSTEGDWAWGTPNGGGGQYGYPDPTSGHTGSHVYGYNLYGDYANYMGETHLTTTAIDCSDLTDVSLRFGRWLGVEQPTFDHAFVRVSSDGGNWTLVWTNTTEVSDASWTEQVFDISAVADGQPAVHVRWTMGPTDSSWQYCGWNIDDVEIWGLVSGSVTGGGDLNCDSVVDFFDIDPFVMALTDPDGYAVEYPDCDRQNADMNDDGVVDFFDIDGFVAEITN